VASFLPQINPALGNTQAFSISAQPSTITAAYRIMSPNGKLNATDVFANSHLQHSASEEESAQISDMLEDINVE
jgi:hypothetical protein